MYYSKSTGGFYDAAIHGGQIPADAVVITRDEHAALLQAQSDGQAIAAGPDGRPCVVKPPPVRLTVEQVQELRQMAYARESDPLKNEAEYDAMVRGSAPDYAAWLAKVAEIKARYPLPSE